LTVKWSKSCAAFFSVIVALKLVSCVDRKLVGRGKSVIYFL
jgi:hypothetical protein